MKTNAFFLVLLFSAVIINSCYSQCAKTGIDTLRKDTVQKEQSGIKKDTIRHQGFIILLNSTNQFGNSPKPKPIPVQEPPRDLSSIYVLLMDEINNSNILFYDILLTNPENKRVGCNYIKEIEYNEVNDGVHYYLPQSDIIEIMRPIAGQYILQITGDKAGVYSLEFILYDKEGNEFRTSFLDIPITPQNGKDAQTYILNFDKDFSSNNTEFIKIPEQAYGCRKR